MQLKKSSLQTQLFGEQFDDAFQVDADTLESAGRPNFLEFFAGSGLVAEGLKPYFKAAWANDNCAKKQAVYQANHSGSFLLDTVENVRGKDLPEAALSWASFPCQDLSLAGNMGGLDAERSGLVWQWLRVVDEMPHKPRILVAENVVGLVAAEQGAHYRRLHEELVARGYKVGALLLDALHWLPQSRPRIFVVAVDARLDVRAFESSHPTWAHSKAVVNAALGLQGWAWWKLPMPAERSLNLADVLELDAETDSAAKQAHVLSLISQNHKAQLKAADGFDAFPAYRRTRDGKQCLELRFDGIAGCLRTPRGGSSRQTIVLRANGALKTRLLTARETARLMGAPDSYQLPGSYNDAYKAMGDAVAVPAVTYLARWLLAPLHKALNET